MVLGLQTLEHRRQALQATFVAKLMSGNIDSPCYLLEKLNLYAPERPLRSRELLIPTFPRFAHSYNAPLNQMIKSFTKYQRLFDYNISIKPSVSPFLIDSGVAKFVVELRIYYTRKCRSKSTQDTK